MSKSNLPLPPVPGSLKVIAHLLKTANEHETRDPVVTYWCRLAALQNGLKADKSSNEALGLLMPLMDWLEKEKKVLADNEAVASEVVASAHIENYAMKLFNWADQQDRAGNFNKNVVKSFYTAGILFDVLPVFGELTPENTHARKYAKWKAAYIHNCLKTGETPIPGPAGGAGEDPEEGGAAGGVDAGGWQMPGQGQQPPSEGMAGMDLNPQIPPASSSQPAPSPKPVPSPRAAPPPPSVPAAAMLPTPVSAEAAAHPTKLDAHQIQRTQKLCKYASSALDYEDVPTAIDNLQKALRLLQTGQEN